ncbi:acyl-CoA N-acyltransferase [Daedaleopsis nitida]|nr:acyl-CoA N-acyltransferase [Daedaleopsis nitida]
MISAQRLVDPPDGDVEAVVQLLVAAFRDDIGMSSLSGGSSRLQMDMYRRTVRACLAQGALYVGVVDGRIQGVAAWIAPGEDWQCYQQEDFISSLTPYLSEWYSYHYIPTYQELYSAAFSSGERARKDGWNLKLLAVHPDSRRKGLGRLLLNTLCQQADASGKRVLTEVKSPYHVSWFRKSGFTHRSVKNFSSKDSAGFPLWCMVRDQGQR